MNKYLLSIVFTMFLFPSLFGQNTVGLLDYDYDNSFIGYTLIYPFDQPTTYLLDNCGEIVHTWEDTENFRPGVISYILENGNLLRAKRDEDFLGDPIWAGGGGEIVELRSWDNDSLWSYTINDSLQRMHHDIEPLPNGNILLIVWESKTAQEAIDQGRNPDRLVTTHFWPEKIIEIEPYTSNIVWEWHAWDHLVQDFDPSKPNFGDVKDHPELIDLNYDDNMFRQDWIHFNSIDYNAELDQILLSTPYFNEIWIIDHSTTTAEAASHSGGQSDKGGDLLYRIGNPFAYKAGNEFDQTLFFQHDARWIGDFLPFGHPNRNDIIVFNNQKILNDHSSVEIFTPAWDMYASSYIMEDDVYLPKTFDQTFTHPDSSSFYSSGLSSAQFLPNNNILMTSGRQGYIVELTQNEEIVWAYENPFIGGKPVTQGDPAPNDNQNLIFRSYRYPLSYPAFDGKDLSSKGFIEIHPTIDFCDFLSTRDKNGIDIKVYPNPTTDFLYLENLPFEKQEVTVTNSVGQDVRKRTLYAGEESIFVGDLTEGVYLLQIKGIGSALFVKQL